MEQLTHLTNLDNLEKALKISKKIKDLISRKNKFNRMNKELNFYLCNTYGYKTSNEILKLPSKVIGAALEEDINTKIVLLAELGYKL